MRKVLLSLSLTLLLFGCNSGGSNSEGERGETVKGVGNSTVFTDDSSPFLISHTTDSAEYTIGRDLKSLYIAPHDEDEALTIKLESDSVSLFISSYEIQVFEDRVIYYDSDGDREMIEYFAEPLDFSEWSATYNASQQNQRARTLSFDGQRSLEEGAFARVEYKEMREDGRLYDYWAPTPPYASLNVNGYVLPLTMVRENENLGWFRSAQPLITENSNVVEEALISGVLDLLSVDCNEGNHLLNVGAGGVIKIVASKIVANSGFVGKVAEAMMKKALGNLISDIADANIAYVACTDWATAVINTVVPESLLTPPMVPLSFKLDRAAGVITDRECSTDFSMTAPGLNTRTKCTVQTDLALNYTVNMSNVGQAMEELSKKNLIAQAQELYEVAIIFVEPMKVEAEMKRRQGLREDEMLERLMTINASIVGTDGYVKELSKSVRSFNELVESNIAATRELRLAIAGGDHNVEDKVEVEIEYANPTQSRPNNTKSVTDVTNIVHAFGDIEPAHSCPKFGPVAEEKMNHEDAAAYCAARGGRLPKLSEFERINSAPLGSTNDVCEWGKHNFWTSDNYDLDTAWGHNTAINLGSAPWSKSGSMSVICTDEPVYSRL
ncbi:hypothetical protein [Vibrio sp. WXL210]|uniref:hypothetical protein n=1 Tax=Vibrio sp. WXL210 TaxID=3450709 RepID=UPI003EC5635E